MKTFTKIGIVAAASFFTGAMPVKNTYILSGDYKVTIHGTSNLHSWDEKVGAVSGDAIADLKGDGSFDLEAIHIKMEVNSIKSDMGSTMNNNTYKALKEEANPQIIFALTSPVKSIQARPNDKALSAKGNLTIAGVTRPVEMNVKISMQERGKLLFEGSQTIKMTDYNVKPPTALLGVLKTGNEITINFKTALSQKSN